MPDAAEPLPIKIAPSILAADFLRLGEQLAQVEEAGAERIHVDVMDGHFVPNLSMGIPLVEAVRRGTRIPVEVHLMIEQPERYLADFARAGSDQIIVHQEVSPHLHRTIEQIKELGRRASVALNPATPAVVLEEVLDQLDAVLVMTVNPGFGGQRFIESMVGKLRSLRASIVERGMTCDLEVDGGVDERTAPLAVAAGANLLVAGTSVFGHAGGPGAGVRSLFATCCAVARRPTRLPPHPPAR